MRTKKHLLTLLVFGCSLLVVGYVLKVSATVPQPGHSWSEIECTDQFCANTNTKQINTSGGYCIAGDCKSNWKDIAGGYWSSSGTNNIYNSNLGNIGLGVTSPVQKFQVNTTSTEAFVVTSAGNVGIGTTSPNLKLEVIDSNSQIGFGTATNQGAILGSSTGTNYGWGARHNGTNWVARQTSASFVSPVYDSIRFGINTGLTIGDTFVPTELMRITSGGNVGIGMTEPTHLIQLAGGAYCDGTGDWIAGSDRSYKKDINYDFKYGLNEVEQLKPVHYVHKQDKDNKKQVGFIAQDILNVLPEVVSGTEGSYGVSYGQITAVLVKAIQEQQNQIKELKDEIEKIRRSQ